jgi:2-methylcitrate dehydratase PrpD
MTAPSATLTERLARAVRAARYEDLPAQVIRKAKDHLLFHLGSALAGREAPVGRTGLALARRLGGEGPCTIIGSGERATAVDAALANAAAIISIGDDYLLPAGGHPGVVTIPAALALAEQEHRSGRELLRALVMGYETLGKLAGLQWMWDAPVPQRSTIPFGAFGPAAAAIHLLRLDEARAANAIAYAANMAMGLTENPFGGLYYGFVARNGISAAFAAEVGATLPRTTLEGEHGFFMAFLGEVPAAADEVPDRLGEDWELGHAQLKRWGRTTGMNYPAIELLQEVQRQEGLDAAAVARVVFHCSDERRHHATGHALGPFPSAWHAGSSGPFHLALLLLDGRIAEERFAGHDDPAIADVLSRFEVRLVKAPTKDYARLEITTRDGRTIVRERERYETPVDAGREWFDEHAASVLPQDRRMQVAQMVGEIERVEDVATLTALFRPGAARPSSA